ncbi:GNAT family N-acetyltransferase [Fodinicurvata sediminis]|uniref:GNAT family N-acetyltransferase n=1 Tax=Fodinicurvata sediminis TaxID=1121832 RepID=UPI0003B2E70B|nr:GNAT family protein [Fodinicurvata sediminis]
MNDRSDPPRHNELGQPVGVPVENWTPRPRPPQSAMEGRFSRVEPLEAARHGDDLFAAFAEDDDGRTWTYMASGPFADREAFDRWLSICQQSEDPFFQAILDLASGQALGVASYMRMVPDMGVIEVGNISLAPRLQKTAAATEAMYLMMRRAFDELGYRRYEWKCDSLNAASRKAAERLGFTFEGIFRQAVVYKGRNRDTAWYAITDQEWPTIRQALESWLDAGNFDGEGHQKQPLSAFMPKPS